MQVSWRFELIAFQNRIVMLHSCFSIEVFRNEYFPCLPDDVINGRLMDVNISHDQYCKSVICPYFWLLWFSLSSGYNTKSFVVYLVYFIDLQILVQLQYQCLVPGLSWYDGSKSLRSSCAGP